MVLTNMAMSNTEKEIAGANIRRLCGEHDVSIRRLAIDLDMNRAYMHDILSGTANATFDVYERIAGYFGVTVRELLTEPRKRREPVGSRR